MEIIDRPDEQRPSNIASDQYYQMQQQDLTNQLSSTASWFYWIAGLSFINTLLVAFDKGMYFFLGLGITQLVDGIIIALFGQYHFSGYIINTLITGLFVFFGVMFVRRNQWALITGMILYGFDSIIFLMTASWLAFAFHLFVLYKLRNGYITLRDALKEKPVNL